MYNAIAQSKYECHCSEIEIDSAWAQSNGVSCFKIPANLIYNDETKGQKSLAVIRAKRTETSNFEPLVYLHGGPGIAVLDVAKKYLSSKAWTQIRKKHDIIMFDYSGTGHSGPYLCEDILPMFTEADKEAITDAEKKEKTKQLFMNCRDSLDIKKIDINAFTTFQMAADADAIRNALGIDKWNVYGVSYGSSVALSSMHHFSEHIKSVVLDSPFPPNAESFNFVSTLNETFHHMQEVINANPNTASQFPDIIADFSATAERLNKNPLMMDGNSFTGDDFASTVFYTFYKTKVVPLIPLALKAFAAGNDEMIKLWLSSLNFEGEYGKENDIHNLAIYCYECKPRNYQQTPEALARKYPYFASLANEYYMNLCRVFRPESPDASYYNPIESNLPTLVLNCEFDPGCPISYGQSAIENMTNATLVIVPNASHAGFIYNDCTINLVETFLGNPSKSIDTSCINAIEQVSFPTSNFEEELTKIANKK